MNLSTILLISLPLLYILGLGEIASRVIRSIWTDYQQLPRQEKQSLSCFFRGLGVVCSLGGLLLGYHWGSQQPTGSCLAVAFCGFESVFRGIRGGFTGALLGAFVSVLGMSVIDSYRSR